MGQYDGQVVDVHPAVEVGVAGQGGRQEKTVRLPADRSGADDVPVVADGIGAVEVPARCGRDCRVQVQDAAGGAAGPRIARPAPELFTDWPTTFPLATDQAMLDVSPASVPRSTQAVAKGTVSPADLAMNAYWAQAVPVPIWPTTLFELSIARATPAGRVEETLDPAGASPDPRLVGGIDAAYAAVSHHHVRIVDARRSGLAVCAAEAANINGAAAVGPVKVAAAASVVPHHVALVVDDDALAEGHVEVAGA